MRNYIKLYGKHVSIYNYRIQYTNEQENLKVLGLELNNSTKLCMLILNISVKYAIVSTRHGGR